MLVEKAEKSPGFLISSSCWGFVNQLFSVLGSEVYESLWIDEIPFFLAAERRQLSAESMDNCFAEIMEIERSPCSTHLFSRNAENMSIK